MEDGARNSVALEPHDGNVLVPGQRRVRTLLPNRRNAFDNGDTLPFRHGTTELRSGDPHGISDPQHSWTLAGASRGRRVQPRDRATHDHQDANNDQSTHQTLLGRNVLELAHLSLSRPILRRTATTTTFAATSIVSTNTFTRLDACAAARPTRPIAPRVTDGPPTRGVSAGGWNTPRVDTDARLGTGPAASPNAEKRRAASTARQGNTRKCGNGNLTSSPSTAAPDDERAAATAPIAASAASAARPPVKTPERPLNIGEAVLETAGRSSAAAEPGTAEPCTASARR
jgi:hypothetical protein